MSPALPQSVMSKDTSCIVLEHTIRIPLWHNIGLVVYATVHHRLPWVASLAQQELFGHGPDELHLSAIALD